ncbi:glycosyltransferase [Clostridium tertium]|jgi:MGT family glycosyltransferase|uniref:macrolide family glycosyltransferase n=2 Tax=Clostridium TaxID=1485 RepID=UPI000DD0BE96|nr:macrolide family glycosyltransferase [Clostridium tertium]MBU6134671.1 glucosyltransferase [Clostridium tertium]MDB1939400.1 glycosyltransferase [Clostridium tertium]MDB1953408.1 glycosyltransferase [Clostridium tertium]MDB1957937.1 glycosyltransferase [Clostridium tertium]MDB1961752.1 glycosyltransferase [Clostridium tertium]
MSKIIFFCIPASGHTNPTIEVVRELVSRGNEVWYYSFNEFKDKIQDAGANFISCDDYLPELRPEDEKKIGKDFPALIEMVVDTTISLDKKVCAELESIKPDCIVSDSLCFWGKLFAKKLDIPYICSTTTFAFNKYTAKMMKQGINEIIRMILGMGRINKKLELLRSHGYYVKDFVSMIQNDNETDTIVYTSKEFQPMVDTFSSKYYFVGPSVANIVVKQEERKLEKIYISLGTVNNKNIKFYQNCIKAFKDCDIDVVMSIGKGTSISELGNIPDNFEVRNSVEQIKVLQDVEVFITHCGMNSVNESLYYGVPMVMYPQQSEQGMVCRRVADLDAGIVLKRNSPKCIKEAVLEVISNNKYKENAEKLGKSFRSAGGYKKAAEAILKIIEN